MSKLVLLSCSFGRERVPKWMLFILRLGRNPRCLSVLGSARGCFLVLVKNAGTVKGLLSAVGPGLLLGQRKPPHGSAGFIFAPSTEGLLSDFTR